MALQILPASPLDVSLAGLSELSIMAIETLSTSPVPITLAEVKAYLRVDFTDDDAVIGSLLQAAADFVQESTGQQVVPATLRLTLDGFPDGPEIRMPRPPLGQVNSIEYVDAYGRSNVLSPSTYVVDAASRPGRVALVPGQCWPRTDGRVSGVSVEFQAGPSYDRPLSPGLTQAIKFLVGHWYEHREAATDRRIDEVPLTLTNILATQSFPEAL